MARTVARLLAESLEAHDVDQVYCVPGESYVGLTSALIERNSIRVIVCRHEGGAGYMAVADGRLRDRAGVALVSRGPGLSNAMVSLHSAYHDATPVVMLVGDSVPLHLESYFEQMAERRGWRVVSAARGACSVTGEQAFAPPPKNAPLHEARDCPTA